MATALIFKDPPGSTALVFGAALAPVDVEITIDVTLPALTADVFISAIAELEIDITLPGLQASIEVSYTSNTARPTVNSTASAWQEAADLRASTEQPYQRATGRRTGAQAHWQDAGPLAAPEVQQVWQDGKARKQGVQSRFEDAARLAQGLMAEYQQALRSVRLAIGAAFEDAATAGIARGTHFQDGIRTRRGGTHRWQDAGVLSRWHTDAATRAAAMIKHWQSRYQDAMRTRPGIWQPPVVPVTPGRVGSTHLLFIGPLGTVHLVFGHASTPPATIVVPIRKVYIVLNSASLRRVQGNIALPVISMSIALDADSWTWAFTASLHGSALANLEPDGAGNPVEVEATINGVPYRMLIEKVSRARSFGLTSITASGRGLSATLDSPYAPVLNHGNSGERTAQQLLGDVLTLNNVALPWAIDWRMEDWVVPGGIWKHQGSYISALNSVVQAAGGYLQPHASSQTLHALHRYPSAPWTWAGATPDIELPLDVTVQEGVEWAERARYNRVFVSGTAGGIIGQVTRTGTDGSQVAPMVTDPLITSAIAARRRGIKELAAVGRQAMLSLSLPVLPETGIIVPGRMVRYDSRIGITRGVSVQVGIPSIRQQIQVETYA